MYESGHDTHILETITHLVRVMTDGTGNLFYEWIVGRREMHCMFIVLVSKELEILRHIGKRGTFILMALYLRFREMHRDLKFLKKGVCYS